MNEIRLSEKISFIPGSEDPLSSDIGIIREGDAMWLYDVGADPRAIEGLTGEYNVVLSHFHRDHTGNLERLRVHSAYVSRETMRHVRMGAVVDRELSIGGLRIIPLPSSHCKGCLGLEVDGTYAFVGDALYGTVRGGYFIFNAQLVKAQMEALKRLSAPYLLVSHREGLILPRDQALAEMEELYSQRDKYSPEIRVKRG